ncbi:MAG: hypothetical protein WA712_17635, partial [Pseudolabrys sp.]
MKSQPASGVTRITACAGHMKHFYEPDLTSNPDSPIIRDGNNKLVRRSYRMDMDDRTFVIVMTMGIGAHLT